MNFQNLFLFINQEDMATTKKATEKKSASSKGTSKTTSKGSSKGTSKSSAKDGGKVEKVMHEFKEGTLKSSSGDKVKSRKQAIAIGLSEAREAGEDVPPPPKKKKSSK
jgi:hypothetical protein